MLIVMAKDATEAQINAVVAIVEEKKCEARPIPGGDRVSIGVLHNKGPMDPAVFIGLPGVLDVIPVTRPYKLVSREVHPTDSVIQVGPVAIGGKKLVQMAGPCAVESEAQALTIAKHVKAAGADMFRGGAYKPRTSPYSFQGLGEEGLKILAKVRETTGMPVVTEVMDMTTFDAVEAYADMIQIGARNMQNFSLLRRAGVSKRPILLKRGLAATIEEWLMAAEYILAGGNTQVVLCERGVRTFVNHSRNTLDLSAVVHIRNESHLPIIVDPSHAGGRRDQVRPLGLAGIAAGAHGLMVEVHHSPDTALSDGAQSLLPESYADLCREIEKLSELLSGE